MRSAISLVGGFLLFVLTTAAVAQECTGHWDGQVATTVNFTGEKTLRYCYLRDCWNVEFAGDKASKLMFRVGNSSATVEMTARQGGYSANWRAGARHSSAIYRCK